MRFGSAALCMIVLCSSPAVRAAEPAPLAVDVDCDAGDDLVTAVRDAEEAAASRVECTLVPAGCVQGTEIDDGESDDDEACGSGMPVPTCSLLPARPLVVRITGTCELEGAGLRLDVDDVTLLGTGDGATLDGPAVLPLHESRLTIDRAERVRLENLTVACIGVEQCMRVTDSTVELDRVRVLNGHTAFGSALRAESSTFGIVDSEFRAARVPVWLVDCETRLEGSGVLGSLGPAVYVRGGRAFLAGSSLDPVVTFEGGAVADVFECEVASGVIVNGDTALNLANSIVGGNVTVRDRSHATLQLNVLQDVSLLEFSTLKALVSIDDGGSLFCDATSNAICTDPSRFDSSTCDACPIPGPTAPGLPVAPDPAPSRSPSNHPAGRRLAR